VSTPVLVEKVRSFGHKNVVYVSNYDAIESYLAENAKEGDAVIVMGAGSVTKLSDQLALRLARNGAA